MANQRERVRDSSIDETATLHPLPGDNSTVAPPDPIPNSEVKRSCADGSVHAHARVGHRQGLYPSNPRQPGGGLFLPTRNSGERDGLLSFPAHEAIFIASPELSLRRLVRKSLMYRFRIHIRMHYATRELADPQPTRDVS